MWPAPFMEQVTGSRTMPRSESRTLTLCVRLSRGHTCLNGVTLPSISMTAVLSVLQSPTSPLRLPQNDTTESNNLSFCSHSKTQPVHPPKGKLNVPRKMHLSRSLQCPQLNLKLILTREAESEQGLVYSFISASERF